jgi:hypothetical protein
MKNSKIIKTILVLCILFASVFQSVIKAQENPSYPLIFNTNEFVMGNPELETLFFDLQPTIYINPTSRNYYGSGSVLKVECHVSQIQNLYEEDTSFETVQLLRIRFEDPNDVMQLNLDQLQSFTDLMYIQFIYHFDVCGERTSACISAHLSNMITFSAPTYTVLFTLGINDDN